MRSYLGLSVPRTIEELTPDPEARRRLHAAFGNAVQGIDLLTGGLAEAHGKGASMGPLFLELFRIAVAQLRATDRFWFERPVSTLTSTLPSPCCTLFVIHPPLPNVVSLISRESRSPVA